MEKETRPPKCNLPWTLPERYVAGQFHHLHRFIVVNSRTMVAVQGDYNEATANRNARILEEQNVRSGCSDTYAVYPLPAPLHDWPPTHWH